jgi:hypothetical protein
MDQMSADGRMPVMMALRIAKSAVSFWHAVSRMSAGSVLEVWDASAGEAVRMEPWAVAALVRQRTRESAEPTPSDDALELRVGPRYDAVWCPR